MYPTFNPNMPQAAQDQVNASRPMFPQTGQPQAFPGQGGFQGQGGPYAGSRMFPGPNGFQGQGGPFMGAQPTGQLPPGGMGQMPPVGMGQMPMNPQGMNAQAMPPQYQQGMNQGMRPPMPPQAQNPYMASNLGFGARR